MVGRGLPACAKVNRFCFPEEDGIMERELIDRAEGIRQRVLQLRDSL